MAKTIAQLKTAIDNLESLLDTGATTVTQDGHTTVFSPPAARKRLRALKKELQMREGRQSRRPIFSRLDLS